MGREREGGGAENLTKRSRNSKSKYKLGSEDACVTCHFSLLSSFALFPFSTARSITFFYLFMHSMFTPSPSLYLSPSPSPSSPFKNTTKAPSPSFSSPSPPSLGLVGTYHMLEGGRGEKWRGKGGEGRGGGRGREWGWRRRGRKEGRRKEDDKEGTKSVKRFPPKV